MTIESTWDFAAGAINNALGDVVTWKPGTGSETEIKAVYGNGFERVQSGAIRIASRSPELSVRASDLPADPVEDDELTVRGITFKVVKAKADVEDVSFTLVLKKAT